MKANLSGTLCGTDYSAISSLKFSAEPVQDELILKNVLEYYNSLAAGADSGPIDGQGWVSLAGFLSGEGSRADFSEIMLVFDGPLAEWEVRQASGCLGYALREVLAGEDLSDPEGSGESHRPRLVYYYDSTKSLRDDPDYGAAFEKAVRYMEEGTPIRATNRAGAGTKGTRLVEGIGPRKVSIFLK